MGRYVDVNVCRFTELVDKLMEDPKVNDRDVVENILNAFGEVFGEQYVLLNNEFYEDYNSYYNMFRLLDYTFKIDSWEIARKMFREANANQSIYEVADKLGLEYHYEEE